jgi:hypothetical protein
MSSLPYSFSVSGLTVTNKCNPMRYSIYRLSILWNKLACYDIHGYAVLWKDCPVSEQACITAPSTDAYIAYSLLGTYKAPIIKLDYTDNILTVSATESAIQTMKSLQSLAAWTRYE